MRAHGSYVKYVQDHCRCDPCRNANRDYERQRKKRTARFALVDLETIVDDCGFRMFEPHEIAAAMAFPVGYIPHDLPEGDPREARRQRRDPACYAVDRRSRRRSTGGSVSRLMSVSHTTDQVRARTKTETRRLGWWTDKNGRRLVNVGDTLTLCEKVMGRRKGEPLVRICDVLVTDVRRERLLDIRPEDVVAEGFPGWSPTGFVGFFTNTFGVREDIDVTVIEWEYL